MEFQTENESDRLTKAIVNRLKQNQGYPKLRELAEGLNEARNKLIFDLFVKDHVSSFYS